MIRRSAPTHGSGLCRRVSHAAGCPALRAALAIWLGMALGPIAFGQSRNAETAPLPAPRSETFRDSAPKLRAGPPNGSIFATDPSQPGEPIGDSTTRGLEQALPPNALVPPEDASELGSSRFSRKAEERYQGPGQPLIQESWNFRPFSISGFYGFVQGGSLIDDWTRENQGVFGGFQLGWDYANYWGVETRFAWAELEVIDTDRAIAAQVAKDDAAGVPADSPFRHRFDSRRHDHRFFWDAHALFYPWGDAAWRPFLLAGFGATSVNFMDRTDVRYRDTLFTVPFGLGVKYRVGDFVAFRVECTDYMGFGGGRNLELLHDLTVLGGFEIRLGGPRRAYWPWNPGRHYW